MIRRITCLIFISLYLQPIAADKFASSFPEYTRIWVGADYWSNRLQDWRVTMGRLECLNGDADMPMRTTHWISGAVGDNDGPFTVTVRTGTLGNFPEGDGSAWSGLLIGAGAGELDYRSTALIHHLPGKGGGLLAIFDDAGSARFLSNDSEDQTTRATLAHSQSNSPTPRTGGLGNHEDYQLTLNASAVTNGTRDLELVVVDQHSGVEASRVALRNVDAARVKGGIAMVSHGGKTSQRRFWFRDFTVQGDAIESHPKRRYGPVLGALYSRSGKTLKLNAQFPPLGFGDPRSATLEIRANSSGEWASVANAVIESPSFTALFRVENLDVSQSWEYRIRYGDVDPSESFAGRIPAAPRAGETLKIAGLTCYQVIARPADGGWGDGFVGSPDGRWTSENVWFPHNRLVDSLNRQQPDLIVLLGDQIYEGGNPTNSDHSEGNPHIDYLYKWYITLWDLHRVTRNVPTIAIVDDHDVYQGDLWGDGGSASINGANKEGGYVHEPEFVRMVERTQTGANPDTQADYSLKQGLSNYFTAFSLANVDIAIIEDRKFKSLPTLIGPLEKNGSKIIQEGYDVSEADIPGGQMLGSNQEAFLEKWTAANPDRVKIGFTQTTYASLHTDPEGDKWIDVDSGGWPQSARNRALEILGKGNTLLLAGDTHLSSVIQHGIRTYRDGPWQFTVPAVANKYRRWWTPSDAGENRRDGQSPYLGDHVDGLGNRVSVEAIGNPVLSNADVFEENIRRGKGYASEHLLLDRAVTKDGYGLIVISPDRQTVTFECWPVDPGNGVLAEQHEGWPVTLTRTPSDLQWKR